MVHLFVEHKSMQSVVHIAVNGFPFLTVKILPSYIGIIMSRPKDEETGA